MNIMRNILISIIIPHYNSPDTLVRLLSSIGHHDDIETIIVDDKSTKYINEFNSCRQMFQNKSFIFVENNSSGKGAGVSRNIGLMMAQGKWLLFADADDYFLPDWYQTICEYIESNDDVVYFKPSGDEDTKRHMPFIGLIEDYDNKEYYAEQRLRLQFYPPWSKLIRKSMVETNHILFDETRYSNDVMFSTKVGYYAENVSTCDKSIYCLSEKEGSLTKQISFESISIRNKVSCDVYSFLKDKISKKAMNNLYLANVPIKTIESVVVGKYGLRAVKELLGQYRQVDFPIINLSFDSIFRLVKRYFKRRGV